MGKLVKYGIFILLFMWVPGAFAQQVKVESPVRFLALGDSYTIGQSVPAEDRWPVQLAERLKNQGVGIEELKIIAQTGWRTDNLLDAIAAENPHSDYNLVSLLIGVNNQYQGRDIAVYQLEFRQLLDKTIELCGGNKAGVFVLSIPDYGYTPFGAAARETISAEIDEYNRINREISAEIGVAWFDITPASREAVSKPEYLASDQLHPSGEMYGKWVDLIFSNVGINISTFLSGFTEHDEFAVYPNPASTRLNIFIPKTANEITVFNGLGEKVYHAETEFLSFYSIKVTDWEPGIYFYRIKNDGLVVSQGKVLVNKLSGK
jgi:lysophospholipase L1-like esterase